MYKIVNGNVYSEYATNGGSEVSICIGGEYKTEEITNEQGEVIETTTKKFNLETGEYEVINL